MLTVINHPKFSVFEDPVTKRVFIFDTVFEAKEFCDLFHENQLAAEFAYEAGRLYKMMQELRG